MNALRGAVIVAHPDDETLWAGGTILSLPDIDWFIAVACRRGDKDRAAKFRRLLNAVPACGLMGEIDDGPEQTPLRPDVLERELLGLLPGTEFDLLLTHGPRGEYTRHRRHEEVCVAVVSLWEKREITAAALWMFAFEDGGGRYLPRAAPAAHRRTLLSDALWQRKYELITSIYGFDAESWEARCTPRAEAFWCFDHPRAAAAFVEQLKDDCMPVTQTFDLK